MIDNYTVTLTLLTHIRVKASHPLSEDSRFTCSLIPRLPVSQIYQSAQPHPPTALDGKGAMHIIEQVDRYLSQGCRLT